jgi:hypothetical protein
LEETVADGNGPKEQAALDALDKAIEDLEAWRDDQDEVDAGQISVRTAKIQALMGPRPGEMVDALTGTVAPQTNTSVGPTSPGEAQVAGASQAEAEASEPK